MENKDGKWYQKWFRKEWFQLIVIIVQVLATIVLYYHQQSLKQQLEHAINMQARKSEIYEQLSSSLEEMFSKVSTEEFSNKESSLTLNKLFGLLAFYAEDNEYKEIKKALEGKVLPEVARPKIYYILRKALRPNTGLEEEDFIKNISASKAKR